VLTWDFISSPLDAPSCDLTGLRPALYGSLLVILVTILFAFPVGVGAAIYLEEYAGKNANQPADPDNINNLAGCLSIIYGMLGLAIFVRAAATLTSGHVIARIPRMGRTDLFRRADAGLLILPVIIITRRKRSGPCPVHCGRRAMDSRYEMAGRSGITCCPTPCPAS